MRVAVSAMVKWSILLFVCLAFSGCVADDPPLELTVSGIPGAVVVGQPFTFTMTGSGTASSTHVGAHYWAVPTVDPDADFDAAGGCSHVPDGATFPGEVTVTCTMMEAGTFQVRGHVRTEDGETVNHWSVPHNVDVLDFTLASSAVPTEATVGNAVNFTLTIDGPVAATSDHIGAHFFADDVSDPTASFGDQVAGCAHQPTPMTVPGVFTVSCTFGTAGTYYVFGHLRVTLEEPHNFWADSFTVVVS